MIRGSNHGMGKGFISYKNVQTGLRGPTQPPIQCVRETFSRGG
jgi:hypothetical protein